MKLSIKKTIPFISMAILLMAGVTFWVINEREDDEMLVQASHEISLSDEDAASLKIAVEEVHSHPIVDAIHVIGKAVVDQDAKSYVVPSISGNVEQIMVKKGDLVKKGDVLASIFSHEAAACKIEYQKSLNEVALMKNMLDTEDALYGKGFSTEQQYLKAKQEYDQAVLNSKYAYDKVERLAMSESGEEPLSRYYLKAPMDGTVVDNTLIIGAIANPAEDSILIADLDKIHIEIDLNEQELAKIHPGSFIEVGEHTGMVRSILPAIDSKTMKSYALADLVDGSTLTPGSIVDVKVIVNLEEVPIAVKKCSVVEADGCNMVFIKTDEGFAPTEVELGRSDDEYVEIVSNNLDVGTQIAEDNLFVLKAEMSLEGDE